MACWNVGGFETIWCILNNGFMGMFGSRILMGVFLLLGATILVARLKLPMELVGVFAVVLIGILVASSGIIPSWLWPLLLIVVAVGVGFGIYKLGRR